MKKTFTGIVISGSKKASALGFPTANIQITEPVNGIYAGTVFVEGKEYFAALFGDEKRGLLEAYIINFSGDLYGKHATFTLLEKIRDHGTFTDDESLRTAITFDVANVKKYFNLPS